MKGSKIKFKFTFILYVNKYPSLSPVCRYFLVSANEMESEVSDIAAGSNQS